MSYRFAERGFFGLWFILLPTALVLLLSAIFSADAAVSAVPDARASAAVAFLAANGWTADASSCQTAEVSVPEQFGPVYQTYNDLQLSQGFDLTPYRGAVLTRYTFTLTAPSYCADGPVLANVFFSGGEIAAADVCAVGLNGFIRGVIGEQG